MYLEIYMYLEIIHAVNLRLCTLPYVNDNSF